MEINQIIDWNGTNLPANVLLQSPWLYLQAAGSDNSDKTAEGIHLRWAFARELGERHLPKGELAAPGAPYNGSPYDKADDHVYLYRRLYEPVRAYLNLMTDVPVNVIEVGTERHWVYEIWTNGTVKTSVALRFMDIAQYDAIRSTGINPFADPSTFIAQYNGVMEVEPLGKLFFGACFWALGPMHKTRTDGCVRMEAVSTSDQLSDAEKVIAHRKMYCRDFVSKKTSKPVGAVGVVPAGTFISTRESLRTRKLRRTGLLTTKRAASTASSRNTIGLKKITSGSGSAKEIRRGVLKKKPAENGNDSSSKKTIALEKAFGAKYKYNFAAIDPELLRRRLLDYPTLRDLIIPIEPPRDEPVQEEDFNMPEDTLTFCFHCENMQYLRFSCDNCLPSLIAFETYQDFLFFNPNWDLIGKFGLSDDDDIVKQRLHHPSEPDIETWPKYNDGATIKPDNYVDRWNAPEGLKNAVLTYLDRSRFEPTATVFHPSETVDDTSEMEVPYLNMLQLVGLDYHAARMLGLGHVDADITEAPEIKYIHLALYETLIDVQSMARDFQRYHLHMSLPTGKKDYRLPPPPELDPVRYGLAANDAEAESYPLTDANGYAPYDDMRVINLDKQPYPYHVPLGPFWESDFQFCMCLYTRPVLYGVEYRKTGQPNWTQPELSHDQDYNDPNGIPEVAPIPEQENPIFIHLERNEGFHDYAIYGVNWFSRVSPLSNVRPTNETQFPRRNTLLPPINLGVQYIQVENPLIFTSQSEQDALAARETANPGGDNALTRVTFEWNHANHHAYQDADYAELFFRETAPANVQGDVKSVTGLSGRRARVRTKSFDIASVSPPQTISPDIAPADESRFLGSFLVTSKGQWPIESIQQSGVAGEGAIFTVQMVNNPVAVEPNNDGEFITQNYWTVPEQDARFMVVENMADDAQWQKLGKTVELIKHSNHSESVVQPDGTTLTYKYAGIYEQATLTDVGDGAYRVDFDVFALADHPDGDVSWYKGSARIPAASGVVKVVEVWNVDQNGGGPLILHVYDPTYASDPLVTGSPVDVNFHPGYKLYLEPEPAATFDAGHILPAIGAGSKVSFMAIRSTDEIPAEPDIHSAISVPVPLLAREITTPEQPGVPVGPTYATRPDYYGKATYTFDTQVNTSGGRQPFSLIFYRANDRRLLDVLYTQATADDVMAELRIRADDGWFSQRWLDVVQFNFDADGSFLEHNGYRLPNPDNSTVDALFTGAHTPGDIENNVRDAIHRAFVPLTERPVVYAYIDTGKQTRNTKPVIRDITTGNLLDPSDPSFDPNPMVVKYTAGAHTKVRFTDYTLDGAGNNVYFYYAVEMTLASERSDPSPIAGPIQLVNAAPAEAPEILSVSTQSANPLIGQQTEVRFTVNAYPAGEHVERFELFRTTTLAHSHNVRLMQSVNVFQAGEQLIDLFDDLEFPPYGETLYYRVVALRRIANEDGNEEWAPSQPSNAVLTSVIDVINPDPPAMTATPAMITSGPEQHHDVELAWNKTAHNATYHLFKMTANGNWRKFYSVQSNDDALVYPPNGDFATYAETALLVKEDDNNNELYHRFRIQVENGSGLVNLRYNEMTV